MKSIFKGETPINTDAVNIELLAAEGDRVQAELLRDSAEDARALAAIDQAEAESDRVIAELARVDAEDDRDDAEGLRAGAEITRGTSEGTRISNENGRISRFNNIMEVLLLEETQAGALTEEITYDGSGRIIRKLFTDANGIVRVIIDRASFNGDNAPLSLAFQTYSAEHKGLKNRVHVLVYDAAGILVSDTITQVPYEQASLTISRAGLSFLPTELNNPTALTTFSSNVLTAIATSQNTDLDSSLSDFELAGDTVYHPYLTSIQEQVLVDNIPYIGGDTTEVAYTFETKTAGDSLPIKLKKASIDPENIPAPTDVIWVEETNQAVLDKLKTQNETPITSVDTAQRTGVWNGQNFVVQDATHPAVLDDFAGKVSGSTVVNPNSAYTGSEDNLGMLIYGNTDAVADYWSKDGLLTQDAYLNREATAESHVLIDNEETSLRRLEVYGETDQVADYWAKEGALTQTSDYYAKDGALSQYSDTKTMGKNLFDRENITADKYVEYTTGLLQVSGVGNTATGYIQIQPSTNYVTTNFYYASGAGAGLAFYDSTKTYISGIGTETIPFTTPSNAIYLRGTVGLANIATAQLEASSSATSFEPYKDTIKTGLVMELSGRNFFNEPKTTTLPDRSGNGNNGTASGFQYRTASYADKLSDFTGKVSGSVLANPNISFRNSNSAILSPSAFTGEMTTGGYSNQSVLNDSNTAGQTTTVSGQLSQELFSFNVVEIFERQYGRMPTSDQTLAGRVAWLKDNMNTVRIDWTGYGSGPLGNKAYLKIWNVTAATWVNCQDISYNTTSSPSLIEGQTLYANYMSFFIDANGFVHFLAYADASDGITASTIYTDYVKATLQFKAPSGSDGSGGIKFDGVDDGIALTLSNPQDVTFEFRAKFTSYVNFAGLGWVGNLYWQVFYYAPDTSLVLAEMDSSGYYKWWKISGLPETTNFHTVQISQVGVNDPVAYIDGVQKTVTVSISSGTLTKPTDTSFNIGKSSTGAYHTWNIAYFRIYNRALSAAEVYQNYFAGANLNVPAPTDASPIVSNLPAGTYRYTYGTDLYEFTLPTELRGIGTSYDKVTFDRVSKRGYVERRVAKVVLNGSESWEEYNTGTRNNTFAYRIVANPTHKTIATDSTMSPVFTSRFKPINFNDVYVSDVEGASIRTFEGYLYVVINKTRLATQSLAGFKTWLGSNNLDYYYELATITSTPLTFTKVTTSAACEIPLTFLTNTPDPLHPADITANLLSV
jgi:YD repeat-containing protein